VTVRLLLVVLVCSFAGLCIVSCSSDRGGPEGGIAMEEASEIVRTEIIPAEVPENAPYICLRMNASIAKGSTVEEAAPEGMETLKGQSSFASYSVDEESYFFFLDLDPYALFEHQVKYVFVKKSGGSYMVDDARWWPKINGVTPSQFLVQVPDSAYIVASNVDLAPIEEDLTFPIPIRELITKEGFIVVQGLMPGERCFECAVNTYKNGLNFFEAYKNSNSIVEGLEQEDSDDIPALIDDMVADGIDVITIFIIAHGSVDRIGLAGHGVSVTTFRNKMAQYPNILFNFMLGSCHSGSFIDDLQTLSNVRVVMTACKTDQGAQKDWDYADGLTDYNVIDSGSEWTSSVLWAAGVITVNGEWFSIVRDLAGTYGIPVTSELLYQAHYGALGLNSGMNLYYNLDLSDRVGASTPQIYHSWSVLGQTLPEIQEVGKPSPQSP
jgi:hypothetical protein